MQVQFQTTHNNMSIYAKTNKINNQISFMGKPYIPAVKPENIKQKSILNAIKNIFKKTEKPEAQKPEKKIIEYLNGFITEDIKKMGEKYKDDLDKLAEIHLKKGGDGKIPLQYSTLSGMKEIHKQFENRPDILRKLHLMPNNKGKIQAHRVDTEGLQEIHSAFKNDMETLVDIHLTQTERSHYPAHYYDSDGIDEIFRVFNNHPEVCLKIFSRPEDYHKPVRKTIHNNLIAMAEENDSKISSKLKKLANKYLIKQ